MTIDKNPSLNESASPPCYLHEMDPAYSGLALSPEAIPPSHIAPWRKAERERLIAQRLSLDAETRARHTKRICSGLNELIGNPAGRIISAYWPFRGEPDLRHWLKEMQELGAHTALPVVIAKKSPLRFRLWREGDKLERGVWNIPVPAEGEEVSPDIVIAPVVGFDRHCYRLGYGGGFFDRTLAMLPNSPLAIGIGYEQVEIASIHPQPFDIPMRHVVTEAQIRTR
jgi:5,10-methenyltetrahydrofolate synthetase